MIFVMGFDADMADEVSYADAADEGITLDEAYLDEGVIEEHLFARASAFRILREARRRGFAKGDVLYRAFSESPVDNRRTMSLIDELLTLWHEDAIIGYLQAGCKTAH